LNRLNERMDPVPHTHTCVVSRIVEKIVSVCIGDDSINRIIWYYAEYLQSNSWNVLGRSNSSEQVSR